MGRDATKAAGNPWYQARKKAAEYDDRLCSRESAAEQLGMSVSSLADAELGNTKFMPVDKAVLMADRYNAPWLLNHYCLNECPIGCRHSLSDEVVGIDRVTVKLLKSLKTEKLGDVKDTLLDIAADGKITEDEKPALQEVLAYKKGQRLRDEDKKAHEMHMGFSFEEKQRCKDSPNPMFVNRFPLVDMELTRADNYAYILDVWGLDTKASACCFCPFHRNYFFENLKEHQPQTYAKLLEVDELLRDKNPKPPMDSDLFISRSRKRLADLTPEDCCDAECFEYHGKQIWNGF